MGIPVAIQLYSIREQAEYDFRKAMLCIKQMGYDGVELAGLYGKQAIELKAILDEVGLTLVSAHVPVEELMKDEVLRDYAAAGVNYVVIPSMKVNDDEASVKENIDRIRTIAEHCSENDLKLLYHNHDFEFKKVNEEYILDLYYRQIPKDLLETELDTCWVNVGGETPSDYIMKYSGRTPIVHLKDFVRVRDERMNSLNENSEKGERSSEKIEFRPIGYGVQDITSIIKAAEESGANWLVVEQDSPSMGKTTMECAKMSIEYLKSLCY